MEPASTEYIRHRLKRFEDSVTETREHFPRLFPFGRYPASAPYYEKSGIRALLDSLAPERKMREEFCREFSRIHECLMQLERDLGAPYRDLLHQELRAYTHAFHATVSLEHIGHPESEKDDGLYYRDRIAVLVCELAGDGGLDGILQLIEHADRSRLSGPERECDPGRTGIPVPDSTVMQQHKDRIVS